MGVRRRWLTGVVVGGLAAVFLGERAFAGVAFVRLPLSVLGAASVLGATLWRVRSWRGAEGEERTIERYFALAYIGCVFAMVGFMVGTEGGVRWMGLDFEDIRQEIRFRRGFLVASSILLTISLLPAIAAQWALRWSGGHREAGTTRVESLRVSEMAMGALSVALAGSFLSLGGYVTAAHDRLFDASYFKTSTPGDAVRGIVEGMDDLQVLLFFPEVDLVKDEVVGYFGALSAATGGVVTEEYDRLTQPWAAAEHNVTDDGTILLLRGGQEVRIGMPLELDAARSRLRVFDGAVQSALLRLARDRRVAYLTVGHGELNDAIGGSPLGDVQRSSMDDPLLSALRDLFGLLSYEVRNLGLQTGLGDRVPDDATMLVVIGPQRSFVREEMAVVEEYLDRGGSLLLALEPDSDFELEGLRERLGVEYRPVTLIDDQRSFRGQGGLTDRRLLVTNLFSRHPAVKTARQRGVGSGILLSGAGHLVPAEGVEGPRTSFIIGAMSSTFPDLNGNLQFDSDTESRGGLDLAAAIEGPDANGDRGMRALVYADAEMFSDQVLSSLGINVAVAADGIRWLGREEAYSGETISEADVPIVHTRAEDVVWFYAIILGAPGLIGLVSVVTLRIRPRAKAS